MAATRQLKTDEISAFDIRQMLLFAEKLEQNRQRHGREDARSRAAAEIPLTFDSPSLQDAVRRANPLLPSLLAMQMNYLARRRDWAARRAAFVGAPRDAHLDEAERRAAQDS